jgi:hypothetical protein
MKDKYWFALLGLLIVLLAVIFNRSVKVSILENVFIEVGGDEMGPPQFFPTAIELPDGRTVYFPCEPQEVKQ